MFSLVPNVVTVEHGVIFFFFKGSLVCACVYLPIFLFGFVTQPTGLFSAQTERDRCPVTSVLPIV